MRHCVEHKDANFQLILRHSSTPLTYSRVEFESRSDSDEDLPGVFLLDGDLSVVENVALEISIEPLRLGSFVCGVGGPSMLQIVSGNVVGIDINDTVFIDSRTAVGGFSGAGIGISRKVVAILQGGTNAQAIIAWAFVPPCKMATTFRDTSIELGRAWVDSLHDLVQYSQTLTRLVPATVLVPLLEELVSPSKAAGASAKRLEDAGISMKAGGKVFLPSINYDDDDDDDDDDEVIWE